MEDNWYVPIKYTVISKCLYSLFDCEITVLINTISLNSKRKSQSILCENDEYSSKSHKHVRCFLYNRAESWGIFKPRQFTETGTLFKF